MSKLDELEARIEAAFARIEAGLVARPGQNELEELRDATRRQQEEIAALREKLKRMREERRRDADDVNAILSDLRPLLEG
ncbi:MAG: hypothetical protein D6754_11020 [Alphaproteobacteria bacterium]|nr:MAG: hypothetical protein D6754_11020 [Alphaproteobacteria bacterium]